MNVNTYSDDLILYFLGSLDSITRKNQEALNQLVSQPWFADGLNDQEFALTVTLSHIASHSPEFYSDFLQANYTQSKTVSLPLAGDINIWVLQNTPFPTDEDLLTIIERYCPYCRTIHGECLFQRRTLSLLVVDPIYTHYEIDPGHFRSNMRLTRSYGKVFNIPHETAPTTTSTLISGRRWLYEGAAQFIEAYFNDLNGSQDPCRPVESEYQVKSNPIALMAMMNWKT